jgi:hypothetical protein
VVPCVLSKNTSGRKGWRHLPKFHGTVASELRRTFSDDGVRSALSGVPGGYPARAVLTHNADCGFVSCRSDDVPGYGVGAAMMSGIFAARALEAS